MKRFLLTFVLALFVFSLFSQSSTVTNPCVSTYTGNNLGGGNCNVAGTGNNKYYPGYSLENANVLYTPTGRITVIFKNEIPAGTAAPAIIKAGPDNGAGGITVPFDYKYAPFNDNLSVNRTSVEYCYYGSASNQNIFNGQKAPKLTFIINYGNSTSTEQVCTDIPEQGTLPVTFKSFSTKRDKQNVSLKWETASEQNNRGFYIQRNTKGSWENIALVFSAADGGNSSELLSYSYNDVNNEKGVSQYRIQQVDLDGKATYSVIRSIRGEGQVSKTVVYPNPATEGKVNVVFEDQSAKAITVSDMSGRVVRQYRSVVNNVVVDGLESGMYTIQITDLSSAVSTTEKVIIKKR